MPGEGRPFRKGHDKAGGRRAGTPNKATQGIKIRLGNLLPDEDLDREWSYFLKHKDDRIRFKAFKLALQYLYGKPVQSVGGDDEQPPIQINVSAVPMKRERA